MTKESVKDLADWEPDNHLLLPMSDTKIRCSNRFNLIVNARAMTLYGLTTDEHTEMPGSTVVDIASDAVGSIIT